MATNVADELAELKRRRAEDRLRDAREANRFAELYFLRQKTRELEHALDSLERWVNP